jgi:cytochrome c556
MRSIGTALATGTGLLLLFVAMAAWGHEHHDHSQATGVVKERMDAMAEMGKRLKAISKRVRSTESLAKVSEDAAFIRDAATKLIPLFPAGSKQPPTEAASAIWRNFADFEVKAKTLEQEAAKLASMKGADAPSVARQATAVAEACLDCHEKYRIKQ